MNLNSTPYWNYTLEESWKELEITQKEAGDYEDKRLAKNKRNRHSKLIKKLRNII